MHSEKYCFWSFYEFLKYMGKSGKWRLCIQSWNINKAPVMHHSLLTSVIKQSIRHNLALAGTHCSLTEHQTIIIISGKSHINTK